MRLPDTVSVVIYVDLLDMIQPVLARAKREPRRDPNSLSRWAELEDQIARALHELKGCRSTCFDHQAWASFEIQARTWNGVRIETGRTHDKVRRIINRAAGG